MSEYLLLCLQNLTLNVIRSQLNRLHALIPSFFQIQFNIIRLSNHTSLSGLFPWRLRTEVSVYN
jgi:hypothetical protein